MKNPLAFPAATRPARGPISRRLKVLHVGKFYPPHMGGIETHLQALSSVLRKHVDLRLLVAGDKGDPVEDLVDGVRVWRMPTWLMIAGAPLCPAMIARIRAFEADILHIHLPNPTAVLAYLASGTRGKLVVTYHSDTVRQKALGAMFEPFVHRMLRRSSAIIATSPDYQRTSMVLARYRDRCHVIPYGVTLEQFERCDSAAAAAIRARFGDRLVLSIGRLVPYKGFEYLIQAMVNVRGKLLIIGAGPLSAELRNLSTSLGLTSKVIFAGEIKNERLTPYYHAADVFALASVARSEAFGIVQIEAMAAGLPVINTNLDSGVPFVSLHGRTGLTVPPGRPDALAAAINRVLDDPDERRLLGSAGRLRARQEFGVDTMIDRTLALYESIACRQHLSQTASVPLSPSASSRMIL